MRETTKPPMQTATVNEPMLSGKNASLKNVPSVMMQVPVDTSFVGGVDSGGVPMVGVMDVMSKPGRSTPSATVPVPATDR